MIYLNDNIENKDQFTATLSSYNNVTLVAMTRKKFSTIIDRQTAEIIGNGGKIYDTPVFIYHRMNDTVLFAVNPDFNDIVTLEPYPYLIDHLNLNKTW